MTQSILVPLDGSALAEQALPQAVMLARLLDAPLLLARVPEAVARQVPGASTWTIGGIESPEALADAEDYLTEVARRPELAGTLVQTMTPNHPVAEGLLRAIDLTHPRAVVMTTHGRSGLGRAALGSVADQLVHASPVPVCAIRAAEAAPATIDPPRRLLVPLDGSQEAEAALPGALMLARAAQAALVLLRIPTVPGYTTVLPETAAWAADLLRDKAIEATGYLETLAGSLDDSGLDIGTDVEIVAAGSIATGILASADEHAADLIVMATHGRTGFRRWMLGSVTGDLLRRTERPVWLVRAREVTA